MIELEAADNKEDNDIDKLKMIMNITLLNWKGLA
jgi:hypothetical protein